MAENYEARVERPEPVIVPPTRLIVPVKQGVVAFNASPSRPNYYQNAGEEILDRRNERNADALEVAYLLDASYNGRAKDEQEFGAVRKIMKDRYIWVFNRNLWETKSKKGKETGVYVVRDPKAIGFKELLDASSLEMSLKNGNSEGDIRYSPDRSIRFVPYGSFTLGEQTPRRLEKNAFVVASYEAEGAEKLARVARDNLNNYKPYIYGLDGGNDQDEQRVSALDEGYINSRLGVNGNDGGGIRNGYAFGVFRASTEGAKPAQKN